MTFEVTFPWPHKDLSPNARVHWARLAKLKKTYRQLAWGLAIEACAHCVVAASDRKTARLDVALTFHPPDRRKRDDQNCLGSCKALLDGLADALGVDDSQWRTSYEMDAPARGGNVLVQVTRRQDA